MIPNSPLGHIILPKLFTWSEQLWDAQQRWLRRENLKEKVQNTFSAKHLPTFRRWAYLLIKRTYNIREYFWNWHYFDHELLPAITRVLLKDGHGPFELFQAFKKYIDTAEERLGKISDENEKERWWNHIVGIFGSFSPAFFESIESSYNSYEIWDHYFPGEWRVTSANSKRRIPRIVLHEFLEWAKSRIFKKNDEDFDKDLTEVIGGLFPNAHQTLFPAFLTLLYTTYNR